MKNWLFALAFIGILLEAGCAWAACPTGTHPVIGPIRCTPSGCTGGQTRCIPRAHRVLYDHVEQTLWGWTLTHVDEIDLRIA